MLKKYGIKIKLSAIASIILINTDPVAFPLALTCAIKNSKKDLKIKHKKKE